MLRGILSFMEEPMGLVPHRVYDLEDPMDMFFREKRKIFTCPQCHYVTDRKNNLKRHIITMHQESKRSLECCGISFHSKAIMREHVSLFHRNGYSCQICSRNFCRKALLRRHLAVHSGRKDFICDFCDYATSHKSNLERHQKIHMKKVFRPQTFVHENQMIYDQDTNSEVELEINVEEEAESLIDLEVVDQDIEEPLRKYKKKKSMFSERIKATHPYDELKMERQLNETELDSFDGHMCDKFVLNNFYATEMADDNDEIMNYGNRRLCNTPYKCAECGHMFSNQWNYIGHVCRKIQFHVGCPVTALFLKMSLILEKKAKESGSFETEIDVTETSNREPEVSLSPNSLSCSPGNITEEKWK